MPRHIMASDRAVDAAEKALLISAAGGLGITDLEVEKIIAHIATSDLEDLITGDNLDAIHVMLPVR